MADPEGNEFCVLDPCPQFRDIGLFDGMVVDCAILSRGGVLGAGDRLAAGQVVRPGGGCPRSPKGVGPYLELLRNPDAKTVKNRVHLDVAPEPGEDHDTAVRRLRETGATPADIGQGDVRWVVLADPEGSEFCVLVHRDDLGQAGRREAGSPRPSKPNSTGSPGTTTSPSCTTCGSAAV